MNIMKRVFGIALVSIAACGSLLLAPPRADAAPQPAPTSGPPANPAYALLDVSCDAKTGQLVVAKGATLAGDAESYYVRRNCPGRKGAELLANREPLTKSDCPAGAAPPAAAVGDPNLIECFELEKEALPVNDERPSTLWLSSREDDPQTAIALTRADKSGPIQIGPPTWTVALELNYAPDGTLHLVHPKTFARKQKGSRYAVAVYNMPTKTTSVFIEGEQAFPAECKEQEADTATCFDVPMLDGVGAGYKTQLDFSTTSAGAFTRIALQLDASDRIRSTLAASAYDYLQAISAAYEQAKKRIKRQKLVDCLDSGKTDIPRNLYCPIQNFAILFFDETGASPFALERVDEDDEVVIVVVPRNGMPIQELTLTTCGNADQARVAGSIVAVNAASAQGTDALGRGPQSVDRQKEKIEQTTKEVGEQKAEAKRNQERAADLDAKAAQLSTPVAGKADANALAEKLDELSRDQALTDDLQDEQTNVKAINERIASSKKKEISDDDKRELNAQRESAQKDILAERYSYEQKALKAEKDAASAAREVRTLQAQLQANTAVRMLVAKHCASPRMQLTVRGEGQTQSSQISIDTLPIYRFSVGLALIADFSTKVEYRSTSVRGETVPVIQRSAETQGLAPPMPFIAWRPSGTNIERKRDWNSWEGLGIGVGISLVEPLDHLYPGVFYEPVPGFGLLVGLHWQTVPELTGGYEENDRVPAGEIGVERKWKAGPMPFVGVNLDAALFLKLVGAVGTGR
ncbi:hypothetical protein [Sorangium sp. So ce1335]|uniref:hypothetical protein n=1 Tax=Sorangium sp. So ce1335 TaxID=3133335 RepID=UPI003F606ECB